MSDLAQTLAQFGQEHLLQFASQLTPAELTSLESQIEAIDFEQLAALTSGKDKTIDWAELARRADPPRAVRLNRPAEESPSEAAIKAGTEAIKAGKVGVILVAGGQGTRLGFDQPKGMFKIGPVSNRTLFEMHCDRLRGVMDRMDVEIPMYVMTSPATDTQTRAYFDANDNCGLPNELLHIFCQGTMPAVDDSAGKILLADVNQIATSPDGHGGLVAALHKQGCFDDAQSRGVEYFFYAQVDNPLAQLCDPELIGHHILAKSQMTTQVVSKRFPMEKVGNVVTIDGKTNIIEYSDLPEDAANQTQPDGSLKFWAGNIAIHVFDRTFLESVVDDAAGLPFHRAHKAVTFVGPDGKTCKPEKPNAIKFERFVFDLLPLAENAIVVEGDPSRVFAPVKNADGAAVDTPAKCKEAILALHHGWLEAAGAKIAPGVSVEIHPLWASCANEVAEKVDSGQEFPTDTFLS
ncbi:MAG TPA: UDP-N-acetylglucosamine pyrophosphorylase [Planctomycetaceae bacterium]|nr:UDP-N-acetylglucosamine pyrophosphorylase [Planctomycetaceae bacterium]